MSENLSDLANPYCQYCGGTGNRHNGYFIYPCNCVRVKSLDFKVDDVTKVEYSGFEFEPKPLKSLFNARKEAKKYLNSLTREELIRVLEEAGFEVEEGNRKVIFTNKEQQS